MNDGGNRPARGRMGRFMRFAEGLSKSGDASTIGVVLVASIVGPCLLGIWLDNRFKTVYWTPILFLLGVFGGFLELFRTVAKMSKSSNKARNKSLDGRLPNTHRTADTVLRDATAEGAATQPTATKQGPRPRVFEVPPPPLASFDLQASGAPLPQESADAASADTAGSDDLDDDAELIRRLLDEPDEDEDSEDEDSDDGANATPSAR